MTRTARVLPALALGLVLALSACGGDDGDDGDAGDGSSGSATADVGSETTISKADFVDQANEICAAGNEELAAGSESIDPADPDTIAAYANDVLVPSIRAQLEDIRALGYPEGDEEMLDGVLADADAALDQIEADPSLLAGDTDPFGDVNATLTDYGLTECGSSS